MVFLWLPKKPMYYSNFELLRAWTFLIYPMVLKLYCYSYDCPKTPYTTAILNCWEFLVCTSDQMAIAIADRLSGQTPQIMSGYSRVTNGLSQTHKKGIYVWNDQGHFRQWREREVSIDSDVWCIKVERGERKKEMFTKCGILSIKKQMFVNRKQQCGGRGEKVDMPCEGDKSRQMLWSILLGLVSWDISYLPASSFFSVIMWACGLPLSFSSTSSH